MYSKDVNKAKGHEATDYENERESVKFLQEAIKLQQKKSRDYQNVKSSVTQADYYPRGLYTIMDTIHAKLLRATSILEAYESSLEEKGYKGVEANFESLEDTFMDIANYASFAGAWCRGRMEGQDPATGLLSNKRDPRKDPSSDLINSSVDFFSRMLKVSTNSKDRSIIFYTMENAINRMAAEDPDLYANQINEMLNLLAENRDSNINECE